VADDGGKDGGNGGLQRRRQRRRRGPCSRCPRCRRPDRRASSFSRGERTGGAPRCGCCRGFCLAPLRGGGDGGGGGRRTVGRVRSARDRSSFAGWGWQLVAEQAGRRRASKRQRAEGRDALSFSCPWRGSCPPYCTSSWTGRIGVVSRGRAPTAAVRGRPAAVFAERPPGEAAGRTSAAGRTGPATGANRAFFA
jgi:hypothetical protein